MIACQRHDQLAYEKTPVRDDGSLSATWAYRGSGLAKPMRTVSANRAQLLLDAAAVVAGRARAPYRPWLMQRGASEAPFRHWHLLGIEGLSPDDINHVLDLADGYVEHSGRGSPKPRPFLFPKPVAGQAPSGTVSPTSTAPEHQRFAMVNTQAPYGDRIQLRSPVTATVRFLVGVLRLDQASPTRAA
jgi:hypothetical protein